MSKKIGFNTHLLGELLGVFVVIIGILIEKGDLYTVLFWLAHDMVILALNLRDYNVLIFTISFVLCIIVILISQQMKNDIMAEKFVFLSSFFIGFFLSYILIYIVLDIGFFQGALVTVPFLLGSCLLFFSISQRVFERGEKRYYLYKIKNLKSLLYLIVVGFLILPTFSSMSGMLPKPPNNISTGFGGGERPYEVNSVSLDINASDFIIENMTIDSKNYDWRVYVYTPNPVPENMPLAIFLHGYEGEEEEVYIDSLKTLASRGIAVIFPQYASNYDVSRYDVNMLNYTKGGSNHPQHEWRYTMAWEGILLGTNYLNENFQEYSPANLWIGGHSLGAGTSLYIVNQAIENGWGNNSLVINLEAPWVHSSYSPFDGDLSNLPNHTIVNVVEYEDDIVVERCIGVWEFDRLKNRDGAGELPADQVTYLKVYSDRRGFPKLISSHYIQASMIRDSLADYAYYKRIDAQAAYIVGTANDDLELVELSEPYFKSSTESVRNMGLWSDGVPVNNIEIYTDPVEINLYNCASIHENDNG